MKLREDVIYRVVYDALTATYATVANGQVTYYHSAKRARLHAGELTPIHYIPAAEFEAALS